MRKALMPLVASLALCGGVTGLLVTTNAQAQQAVAGILLPHSSAAQPQSAKKPMMVALAGPGLTEETAVPSPAGGPGAEPDVANGSRRGQFCKDMYARKVGELAFLETKLSLTPAQTPLFARWKQVSLDTARQHAQSCESFPVRKAGARPSILDRLALEEKFLKTRLADIEAERPALSALYASLTPQQQAELGHGRMGGDRGMMHRMGPGPRGGMGHGSMEHGPDGAPPPPPPAQ